MPLSHEDCGNGQPYSQTISVRSIQGAGKSLHRRVSISHAQKRAPGRHQDVDVIVAVLLGQLNFAHGFRPIAFLGMNLGSQGIDPRLRGGQLLCDLQSVQRLLRSAETEERVRISQFGAQIIGNLLQSGSVLGFGVGEILLLAKRLSPRQAPYVRFAQRFLGCVQLSESGFRPMQLQVSECQA